MLNHYENKRCKMKKTTIALLLSLFLLNACEEEFQSVNTNPGGGEVINPEPENENLIFGNPSQAGTSDDNNYLLDKTYYTLSYNKSRAIPNWVSWYVNASSFGTAQASSALTVDSSLPAGWFRAENYSGSGFTEGQNCPAGDRTSTTAANASTYIMTNMAPMAPNTATAWKAFEDYVRSIVTSGKDAYMLSGSYGTGGTGSNGSQDKIMNEQVTVPGHLWGIAVIISSGNEDVLNRVSTSTRIVAVDLINNNVTTDWSTQRVSVDALETATGYNFLSALPDALENLLEAKVDDTNINGGGTDPGTDPEPYPGIGKDNDNMAFGNPSNATTSITDENNYLMDQKYFVESYNRSRVIPNWVCWYVGKTSLGSTDRTNSFREDPSLPSGWYRAGSSSYESSGFNRGHNCPSGDRTTTTEANRATFLMTNMIPQTSFNNGTIWGGMETYTRNLVTGGNNEVYIIMGSYGTGGTNDNGVYTETINNGRITVPKYVWKVVVVLPNGDNDVSRVTTSTRVIAVITPNVNTGTSAWQSYRVSVDAIEAATGYDLLSVLPDDIENVLEAKVDNQ